MRPARARGRVRRRRRAIVMPHAAGAPWRNTVSDTAGAGITVTVSLLAPGAAPRSEGGKLRRTVDERAL